MRPLGKLLIIWGALLPLLALPSIAFGLSTLNAHVGSLEATYDSFIVWALVMLGFGLSLHVMPE